MSAWILVVQADWDEMLEYCESGECVVRAWWGKDVNKFSAIGEEKEEFDVGITEARLD